MRDLEIGRVRAEDELQHRKCQEEVAAMTARSEDLKLEVQRLEEELEEKRRGVLIDMEVDSSVVGEVSANGTEFAFSSPLQWSTVAQVEEFLFQLEFGDDV